MRANWTRKTWKRTALLAAGAAALLGGGFVALAGEPDVLDLENATVEGTELVVHRENGKVVRGAALAGAIVVAMDEEGNANAVRIDKVYKDPNDPSGDLLLYAFSVQSAETGKWESMCEPDDRGISAGFPLAGSWSNDGVHRRDSALTLSCTSGAIGKCVRFGYKPWKTVNGQSLWDYHQACTRMVRADYCGDGEHHTRDGTPIEVFDRLDIETDTKTPGLRFEAGWGPDGATCVAKPRLSDGQLEKVLQRCPARIAGRVHRSCDVESERREGSALVFNKS